MHRLLHITLVTLLLFSTQLTPAWAHRHESLSPQELAVHLRQYHAGTPDTQIPPGWHVHRSAMQLIDPALEVRLETELTNVGFDSCDQLQTNCPYRFGARGITVELRDCLSCKLSPSLPFFLSYQSLLL